MNRLFINKACAFSLAWFGLAGFADAATIGYWRMESGGLLVDSSGNGNTLSNNLVGSYTLPGAGPGSKFPSPVPATGQPNAQAGHFVRNTSDPNLTSFFYRADGSWIAPIAASGAFTAEAFVHLTSLPTGSAFFAIVSQYDINAGGGGRSFLWQATNSTAGVNQYKMNAYLSTDGTNATQIVSNFILAQGVDYYTALSVKTTGPGAGITFYLQDLTNNGPLLSETHAVPGSITGLFNSTADFRIGSRVGASAIGGFDGYIDEVRLSSAALGPSQLLIVPEPASWLLLVFGAGLTVVVRRRRAVRAR